MLKRQQTYKAQRKAYKDQRLRKSSLLNPYSDCISSIFGGGVIIIFCNFSPQTHHVINLKE